MNYTIILPKNEFHDPRDEEREREKKEHRGPNSPSRRRSPSHLRHIRSVAPSRWQNTSVKPTFYNTRSTHDRSTQTNIDSNPSLSPIHKHPRPTSPIASQDPPLPHLVLIVTTQDPPLSFSDRQPCTDEYRLSFDLVLNPPKTDRHRR